MKKAIIVAMILISFFVCCKKGKTEEVLPVVKEPAVLEASFSQECYRAIIKKDTIAMTLNIRANQVASGKLSYKFFEKDKNEGTLIGEMKGDTLFADYTFISEGISSVRQLAFLKKGNTYIEGYGDIIDDNGKVRFKNTKHLNFDSKTILSLVDCEM